MDPPPRPVVARMLGLLVLVVVGGTEARLPYAPAQVLTSTTSCADATGLCRGRDVAFVLTGRKLLALDYGTGATFEANNGSQLRVVSSDLPFSSSSAFGVARAADGSLVLVAGDCHARTSPQVWTLDPDEDGKGWIRKPSSGGGGGGGEVAPPLALGATLAFSSTLAPIMDRPSIYSYGGMCPDEDYDDANDGNWQAHGEYSKTMRRLTPDEHDGYVVGTATASAPRTALAGFSLTALPGSATNISGTVTQRASFVLLGGHTRQAFINMSTAAVWSLPEEAWTYVDMAASSSSSSSSAALPDSRSGHTAVLSADGRDLVILGGWVGDTGTAARPQLLLLRRGPSGAYSSWRWSVPERQPEEDLFGHGAALLPGNVMMVYGGRTVTSQDEKGLRFLNLSSMEWLPSYRQLANVHSSSSPSSSEAAAPDLTGSNPSLRRLALGLGLGLGLGLLVGIVIALCAWRRKRKRIRRGDGLMDSSARYSSLVRKPLPAETRFDAFVSSAAGAIHPIPEADEDEPGYRDDHHNNNNNHHHHHHQPVTPTSDGLSDPFATPPVVFRSWPRRHEADVAGHHHQQSHQYQGRESPEADGSLSSGSYNTARSGGFTALQAEAPGLLLGSRSDDDGDGGGGGGSPSKSRRSPRRSWFGSLRRVFSVSGTTSSSSSAAATAAAAAAAAAATTAAAMAPTRPSFDRATSDFVDQPRLFVDELLRRRQGRLDWEHDVDDGHVHVDDYDDYDDARGGGEGGGEWDIERAAEQRLVQVMFTVPRERLRVVNGMEEEEMADEGPGSSSGGGGHVLHQPQVAELVDPGPSEQEQEQEDQQGRRVSTDNSSWRLSTAAVLTAEAVTLARPPRTRVLQMVDSIESRSNSPAGRETMMMMTTAEESQGREEAEAEEEEVSSLEMGHGLRRQQQQEEEEEEEEHQHQHEPARVISEDDDDDDDDKGRRYYDSRKDRI